MKRVITLCGVVLALAPLCSLFGCNSQQDSAPKSTVPGGGPSVSGGGGAGAGKKSQPAMPPP